MLLRKKSVKLGFSIPINSCGYGLSLPHYGNIVINPLCKIIVPDNLYSQWKTETNWVTYANYIYRASDV